MNEGVLIEQSGTVFPYEQLTSMLYGYENRYGAIWRVAVGGIDPTAIGHDPENDLIELNPVGLTVPPSVLYDLPLNYVQYLYDAFTEEDRYLMMETFSAERPEDDMRGVLPMAKYNEELGVFECLNQLEATKLLRDLHDLPPRTPTRMPNPRLKACCFKDTSHLVTFD